MASKCIDHIGQEIVVGDWAAVTQHNTIYVGKVIKADSSVTIATSAKDEFVQMDANFKKLKNWQDKKRVLDAKFPNGWKGSYGRAECSWARDGKFIKITPTEEMLIAYDK